MSSDGSRDDVGAAEPSAASVLRALLDDQVAAVRSADGELRTDDPSSIHRTRVALRRLRSTLQTMAPILDHSAGPIAEDLKWFSNQLGPARDAHAQKVRLTAPESNGTPPSPEAEAILGPVLLAREERGTALAEEAWSSERHEAMMTSLGRLFASEVITAAGDRPATEVLAPLVGNDLRRVRRRADELDDSPSARDDLVHELRKATKRARYTSALLVPSMGKPAERLGRQLQRLQDLLGERQDSAVVRALLTDVLHESPLDSASERAVRQLMAREEARSAELERGVPGLVRKVLKRGRFLET